MSKSKKCNKKKPSPMKLLFYKTRGKFRKMWKTYENKKEWKTSLKYRHNKQFPLEGNILYNYLKEKWEEGWFDSFDDKHFIIQAINGSLSDFVGKGQMLYANRFCAYCDENNISDAFCLNFAPRLQKMEAVFGTDKIRNFVENQLSAGKEHYDEDTFFEALSEISILSFFSVRYDWTKVLYEPPVNDSNAHNPEAAFIYDSEKFTLRCNIEVKTARYPHVIEDNVFIPTVLVNETGIKQLETLCNSYGMKFDGTYPKKLLGFIKSACQKFSVPESDEVNILCLNWTFRNYKDNSFLEAWSLLTNKHNGLLTHPDKWGAFLETGESMPDLSKITAIIVYAESLDGLLFNDFSFVLRRNGEGSCFRFYVTDKSKVTMLRELTQMNPDNPETQYSMSSCNVTELHNIPWDRFKQTILDNLL